MLDRMSVLLLWAAAVLLLAVGIPAFLAPAWASAEFPWTVGPFLAQTIGGWSIGTAAMAALAAYRRRLASVYAVLVYCGLFGMGQLVVVGAFADRLQSAHILTWPYLGGMAALAGAGLAAAVDVARHRRWSDVRGRAGAVPRWAPAVGIAVAAFVLLLAVGTLLAGPDGATARGGIFPEPMGLFSIRAFSVFLFAIAAAIASVLPARSMRPYRELAAGGILLIVPITVAALLNLSLFDFAGRPGGLLYLVAYVVVGIVLATALIRHRPEPEAGLELSDGRAHPL